MRPINIRKIRLDFIPKIMMERIISLFMGRYTTSPLLDNFISLMMIKSGRNM